jgi:pimeloyl-ACP methyl ester carboxylesterase/DNA-binding CsgD family transcriptional regulator
VEPQIRFCRTDLGRIAFATMGQGPAFVMVPGWVSNLEVLLEHDPVRSLIGSLADRHTLVSYDALGTGLSERKRSEDLFSLEAEVEVLDAVLDAAGTERCTLFAPSAGGPIAAAYAAAQPARVQRLILYGTYADGKRIAPEENRRTLPGMVAQHWGLGSRVLASVFVPTPATSEDLAWFISFQRSAATPEMAARLLRFTYEIDATEVYRRIVVPTLVMHRRGDVAIPYELGLEVASLVPDARFESLDGADHPPWLGDVGAVLEEIASFVRLGPYRLESGPRPRSEETASLTRREREILRLVGVGLTDAEIAERLVISPHTVHRHIANIRTKLGQPSRAAAAATATRRGLI